MANELSLKILVEETVRRANLLAEHGISIWIEFRGQHFLFDTGQLMALRWNAPRLEINLEEIDAVILSHGHYDHTGGLADFLRERGEVPVYAHPDIFVKRFHVTGGLKRDVGIQWEKGTLESMGAKFHFQKTFTEIFPDVFLTGEIPRKNDFETIESGFQIQTGEALTPDMIWDDQALVLNTAKGLVVIFGCGHSGLVNTLTYIGKIFNKKHFHLIMGGLHLINASEIRIKKTIEALEAFSFDHIAPLHCTGFRASAEIFKAFPKKYRDWHVADAWFLV